MCICLFKNDNLNKQIFALSLSLTFHLHPRRFSLYWSIFCPICRWSELRLFFWSESQLIVRLDTYYIMWGHWYYISLFPFFPSLFFHFICPSLSLPLSLCNTFFIFIVASPTLLHTLFHFFLLLSLSVSFFYLHFCFFSLFFIPLSLSHFSYLLKSGDWKHCPNIHSTFDICHETGLTYKIFNCLNKLDAKYTRGK